MIQNKRAVIPVATDLLHHLTKMCMCFQIFMKAVYIPRALHQLIDLLSREHLDQFCQLLLTADKHLAPMPDIVATTLDTGEDACQKYTKTLKKKAYTGLR